MKPRVVFVSLLFLILISHSSKSIALAVSELVGKYELQGAMEMAGLLVLKSDQSYTAGFSYGAADWVEEGAWKTQGNELVLGEGRFKVKNTDKIPLFLPSGTRFTYQDGKLRSADPQRKLVFLDPNKSSSSEGRMRVKGRVTKLDSETLVIDVKGECMNFDLGGLSEATLNKVKASQGKAVDVEIPYSAIRSSGGCF